LMPTYSSRKIFVDVELQLEFSPYIWRKSTFSSDIWWKFKLLTKFWFT
jgi:hypothetical protein